MLNFGIPTQLLVLFSRSLKLFNVAFTEILNLSRSLHQGVQFKNFEGKVFSQQETLASYGPDENL